MDISEYNRNSWNLQSREGCRWSTPFPAKRIEHAKNGGNWEVLLTPNKSVPPDWFPSYPSLSGLDLLGLASGGGQQIPLFAASGARVASFENSDVQLQKDVETCSEHGLEIFAVQGDMRDLSAFSDESFDLIFHPVSNVYCPDIIPVWRECFRVLRPGGRLLSGFMNPAFYLFDHQLAEETGELKVRFPLPYSDLDSLPESELSAQLETQLSLEYSHSWEEQIGGQCQAGFVIADFFEDRWDEESTALDRWMSTSGATLARKILV